MVLPERVTAPSFDICGDDEKSLVWLLGQWGQKGKKEKKRVYEKRTSYILYMMGWFVAVTSSFLYLSLSSLSVL